MTVITRWDPFREFSTLQDRMNRLFQQSYNEGSHEALTSSTFAPSVDVYEDAHNVVLKLDVPGIDEKALDVASKTIPLPVTANASWKRKKKKRTTVALSASMA